MIDTFAKPRRAYVGAQDVWGLCFVRSTGTLLIATLDEPLNGQRSKRIVSLSRYGEVLQVADRVAYNYEAVHLVELSGGKVLCGNETIGSTQLRVLHVSRDHHLEFTSRIEVPEGFFRFDALVVDSNIHVALVDNLNAHVRLCLLLQSSSSLWRCRVSTSRKPSQCSGGAIVCSQAAGTATRRATRCTSCSARTEHWLQVTCCSPKGTLGCGSPQAIALRSSIAGAMTSSCTLPTENQQLFQSCCSPENSVVVQSSILINEVTYPVLVLTPH